MPTFPQLSSGSMVVTPSLSTSPIAMYPMHSTTSWLTRVQRFCNDSEQSWTVRQNLLSVQLTYTNVNGYDAARVEDFFFTQKGMFVDEALINIFSINLNGVGYSWCVFDQDTIDIVENPDFPGYFSFTVNLKQIRHD